MRRNFRCSGFLSPSWGWKHRHTPTAEVGKILFVEKRREEKDCILENAGGPGNRWSRGLGWGLGFIAFFCIAWRQRCLSGADRGFLGRRDVSLITYHLLGPPAVHPLVLHSPISMVTLTAVRDRDNEVYSVTASCWQGVMEGPTASGLTMRGVVKGSTTVGCFHFHQRHL
jgi:hypothetical protein